MFPGGRAAYTSGMSPTTRHGGAPQAAGERAPWRRTVLTATAGVLAAEALKHALWRDAPPWASHMATALLLAVAAALSLRHLHRLWLGQQRRAAEALRDRARKAELREEERARFESLLRLSTDHIYFKDAASRFTLVNERLARWFGLPDPAAAVGKTDRDFFSPEHAQQALRDEQMLLRGNVAVISKEEKETWPDGHVTWVSTTKLPFTDRLGRIVGTFGISRDITSHKRTEAELEAYRGELERRVAQRTEALQESEQRYRRLLATVTDYVYEVDVRDGRAAATRHGPGCEAVTGYTTDDYANNPLLWYQMVHPDDRAAVLRQSEAVLTGEDTPAVEHRLVRKDGRLRWVRNTVVVRRDAGGRVTGFDGLVSDISERREAEDARVAMEHTIMQVRQQEILERADRLSSLGFLAGGIAHEVSNPLQGMLSHLSLLRRELEGRPGALRSLQMVERGVESISGLIERLLWLGGEGSRDEGHSRVADALQFVRELLGPQLSSSGIRLDVRASAAYVEVAMPHQELVQVLLNLLMNARDAMPGGGTLTLAVEEARREAVIRVGDTGSGIPAHLLSKIFSPFFTTKGKRGTGLGLSVAESVLRGRGGRIAVETAEGRGTTFTLWIPLAGEER